jgi:hypothetical protein
MGDRPVPIVDDPIDFTNSMVRLLRQGGWQGVPHDLAILRNPFRIERMLRMVEHHPAR